MRAEPCQADSLEAASTQLNRLADLSLRGIEHMRRYGALSSIRKVFRFVRGAHSNPHDFTQRRPSAKALHLAPGDLVQVKSAEEIAATLDSEDKLHGLAFLPGMAPFCGRQFRVFKRMETLYQEESGQVRRMKNTVLLEAVYCDGLLMRCDRSCFYFWREAWLRRVSGETSRQKN